MLVLEEVTYNDNRHETMPIQVDASKLNETIEKRIERLRKESVIIMGDHVLHSTLNIDMLQKAERDPKHIFLVHEEDFFNSHLAYMQDKGLIVWVIIHPAMDFGGSLPWLEMRYQGMSNDMPHAIKYWRTWSLL